MNMQQNQVLDDIHALAHTIRSELSPYVCVTEHLHSDATYIDVRVCVGKEGETHLFKTFGREVSGDKRDLELVRDDLIDWIAENRKEAAA